MRRAPRREQLIEELKLYLDSPACPAHGRLPRETELAARFGVARKTLRSAFDELEAERKIERIHGKGTFKCVPRPGSGRCIYFLVPCSDFMMVSGMSSACRLNHLHNGLLAAAARLDCRVAALPYSPTNRSEDIDYGVMNMIEPGAAVFVTSRWFRPGFAFLRQRGCRVAFFHNENLDAGTARSAALLRELDGWLQLQIGQSDTELAVTELLRLGCRRPALVARDLAGAGNPTREGFRRGLHGYGIAVDPALVWDFDWERERVAEFRDHLTQMQRRTGFDGLVIDVPVELKPDLRYSMAANIGLPETVKIITQCEYACNRNLSPQLPFIDYDYRQICRDAAMLLLSEQPLGGIRSYAPVVNRLSNPDFNR